MGLPGVAKQLRRHPALPEKIHDHNIVVRNYRTQDPHHCSESLRIVSPQGVVVLLGLEWWDAAVAVPDRQQHRPLNLGHMEVRARPVHRVHYLHVATLIDVNRYVTMSCKKYSITMSCMNISCSREKDLRPSKASRGDETCVATRTAVLKECSLPRRPHCRPPQPAGREL